MLLIERWVLCSLCSCQGTLYNLVHASSCLWVRPRDIISLMLLMLPLNETIMLPLALFTGVINSC